jgi:hypothetical protein
MKTLHRKERDFTSKINSINYCNLVWWEPHVHPLRFTEYLSARKADDSPILCLRGNRTYSHIQLLFIYIVSSYILSIG